jgi:hypothetical protein
MPRTSPRIVSRQLLITETGSLQLWQAESMNWKREEGLAHVADVGFLDVQQSKSEGRISSGGTWERWTRHLGLIGGWRPDVSVSQFVDLFLAGNDGDVAKEDRDWLKESFGFRKWAVLASELGKLYALDLGSGDVVWERIVVSPGKFARVSWKKVVIVGDEKSGERVHAIGEVQGQEVSGPLLSWVGDAGRYDTERLFCRATSRLSESNLTPVLVLR